MESVTKNIGLNPQMAKISESGIIGADGKLHLPMDRLNAFFASNKGQRVVARFEAATPGSTEAQRGYYYNYVLPTIQPEMAKKIGERMTEKKIDSFLLSQYPGDTEREDGKGPAIYGRELNQTQMADFLEWLKQLAAEYLFVYVEDPKAI